MDIAQQSSINAAQLHCPTCSPVQGGQFSGFSKALNIDFKIKGEVRR